MIGFLGRAVRLGEVRGRWLATSHAPRTLITTHPAAILRAPEGPLQQEAFARFVAELKLLATAPDGAGSAP